MLAARFIVWFFLGALCFLGYTRASIKQETRRSEAELGQLCRKINTFKKISQMNELISLLRPISKQYLFDTSNGQIVVTSPINLFNQNPMMPCIQQADAILDLDEIINERTNVCANSHLNKIENYHDKYIKPLISSSNDNSFARVLRQIQKVITAKFFRLYADQVSFLCKSNLLHSLKLVESNELVEQDDYVKALPWLSHANSIICKKIDQQHSVASKLETKQQQVLLTDLNGFTKEEIQQCKASKALSEISTINELVEAFELDEKSRISLEKAKQDDTTGKNKEEIGSNVNGEETFNEHSGLFLIVPPDQMHLVKDMLISCSKLRPIYEQTIQPIVRLARLGYNPSFNNFDKVCTEEKLIQKWFGITLVCNAILSSHLTDINRYQELKEDFEANKKSLIVIDELDTITDSDQQDEGTGLSKVLELMKNPIEDELWVYKYGTNKLQRFRDGVLKKIFKLFNVEDIDDHVVFRKRLADTNHWIIRVVIITVSLLTLR